MLKLFEQPEIPSDNVQYLHFITDTLKSIHETLDFLSGQSAELDDLIHQHIDSDSQFRSRLFIWRKELLNWKPFVESAKKCQCELHAGQTSVDDYMQRCQKGRSFVDRPKDCQEASAEEKAQIILALKSFTQNSTYGKAVRDILGQHLFGDILVYSVDLQGEDMSKITPTTVLAFPWDSLNQVLSAVTLDQLIDVD